MGKSDEAINEYLADPVRFADMVNQGLFQGTPVLNPDKLKEMDSVSRIPNRGTKTRDIVKMYYDNSIIFAILAIENQTNIHYAMPLRSVVYDIRAYEKQRKIIVKRHEKNKDLAGAEWLSRFGKNDKLIPTVTLVLYYGSEEWEGPVTLHDMLNIPDSLKPYQNIFFDYHINLLEINKIQNLEAYSDDLKIVLGFIKYQKNAEALMRYIKEHETLFQAVSEENCLTIQAITKSDGIMKYKYEEKEQEVFDVCKALEDLKNLGKIEGKIEGKEETILELVEKKLKKGQTVLQIAEALEEKPEYIEKLILKIGKVK